MTKRATDLIVALVVLAVTAPLLAAVAAVNWLSMRRVFFRQVRVGRELATFVMVKFQTMIDGAQTGSTVTAHGDARVTALGRMLRKLKLDELPQLLNVIRGEMSLVGPRPLTPNEVAAIPAAYAREIYAVRPGMAGIATLAFIDEERLLGAADNPEAAYFTQVLPRKVALELAYARRRTWLTDLVILLLTPVAGLSTRLRHVALRWLLRSNETGHHLVPIQPPQSGGPVAPS